MRFFNHEFSFARKRLAFLSASRSKSTKTRRWFCVEVFFNHEFCKKLVIEVSGILLTLTSNFRKADKRHKNSQSFQMKAAQLFIKLKRCRMIAAKFKRG